MASYFKDKITEVFPNRRPRAINGRAPEVGTDLGPKPPARIKVETSHGGNREHSSISTDIKAENQGAGLVIPPAEGARSRASFWAFRQSKSSVKNESDMRDVGLQEDDFAQANFDSSTAKSVKKERNSNEKSDLSNELVHEMQEAFYLFDSKGDGKIKAAHIGQLLRALGLNPTESDVMKRTIQHEPNDRIEFEVFLPIYHDMAAKMYGIYATRASDLDDMIQMFRSYDNDGIGVISSAVLRYLLTTLGEKLTDAEVDQLLLGREDSNGNVNYEKLVHSIMNE